MVPFYKIEDWLTKKLSVKTRLQMISLWYMLSIMVSTRKHSLEFASEISGKDKSLFSRFLKEHSDISILTLQDLSKKQAKKISKTQKNLESLPWKAALIIDATSQNRSSKNPYNSQKLNHGKGYYLGHQWTNIVLFIDKFIVPLPPIPFYGKKYCQKIGLEYKTEHVRVLEYLRKLDLNEYLVDYRPEDVVVLGDRGYDDKQIQSVIREKGWDFVIALKKTRSVKSTDQHQKSLPSRGWSQVEAFFKAFRRLKWQTVCINTNGAEKKRKEFRIRSTIAWLRGVGLIQVVCSEKKKKSDGYRKYFACSNLTIKPRLILIAYSLRWKIELFHKSIKMHLGFEHVATKSFDSVIAHVHWVYCAYLLLQDNIPGVPSTANTILDRQKYIMDVIGNRSKAKLLQMLTQYGGLEKVKKELKTVLAA